MNSLLYGWNSDERIVAVHPASDRTMRIFIRNSEGIVTKEAELFPFFHLSNPSYLKDFGAKYWIKELAGDNYYRYICAFQSWIVIWDAIHHIIKKYNENAPTSINSYLDLPVIHFRPDPVPQFLLQSGRTLFKGMKFDDLHRLQLSIAAYTARGFKFNNPYRPDDRIILITLSDNHGWEYMMNGKRKGEAEMLQELIRIIKEKDFDVLEGHNLSNFDIPYIFTRCELLGIDFNIGRDGSPIRSIEVRTPFWERGFSSTMYEITGRHVIDTLQLLQHTDISKIILEGYEPKSFSKDIPPDRASWYWDHEPETLIQHNLDNVREIRLLSERLSPGFFQMTKMLPYNYGTVTRSNTFTKIESILLREYIHEKHSVPKPEFGSPPSLGYFDMFYSGVLGPVIHIVIDLLYPKILLTKSLSPKTDLLNKFQQLLNDLIKLQDNPSYQIDISQTEDDKLEDTAFRASLRNMINSLAWYLDNSRTLFNDFTLSEELANFGKSIIQEVISFITSMEGVVLLVDTDEIYFVPPVSHQTEIKKKHFIERINEAIPLGMNVIIQREYKRIFCYKKKNYALLDYDNNIQINGTSLISRMMERFGREFIHGCIDGLLNRDYEKLHNAYIHYSKAISERKLTIKDFSRTEVLRESFDEYTKSVESGSRHRAAAYEVAIKAGISWKPGDHISYYITGDDSTIRGFENHKPAIEWDPNFADENVKYYLKRLDEFAKKLENFFKPQDFHAIFSIDDLFSFPLKDIQIITSLVRIEGKEPLEDDEDFITIAPKIWLNEE
ncbi:MAG: 3'-5' exonuclease [Bacteroidota bacterium]|nr:3'-5' exonuclease [Bacteroidota bacterium]